eukprot:gene12648-3355_t
MPGANCSVFGCGTSRRDKGISLFKLPAAKDKFTSKWRDELLSKITRDRVLDADFRRQIKEDRLHICERHFEKDKLYIYSSRKSLKDGALPTLFLPEKSVQTKKSEQRNSEAIRKRSVVSSEPPVVQRKVYYNNLDDVETAISCLKAQGWEFTISPESVKICKHHKTYILPMFEIFIDSSLSFTVRVHGWLLPDDHLIYKENLRSVRHLTLSRLMLLLEGHDFCQGIEQLSMHLSSTVKHVLPKHFDMFSNEEGVRLCQDEVKRSINCELLITDNDRNMCLFCEQQTKCEVRKERAKEASLIPAKLNAPVTVTNPQRLKLTMQQLRNENADLKTEIEIVKQQLEKASVPVQKHLDKDLQDIFNQYDLENYFGRQRAIGSRRDNPSVRDVGYNDNVIKSQFSVAPLGNVKAVNKWNNIEETPLPKRKKT